MNSAILVTGGAGFIGSHMTYSLLDAGDRVVVLDNLSTGLRKLVSPDAEFVEGDVADQDLVRAVLRSRAIEAVIHFAGSTVVPESVVDPLKYYRNNTAASSALIGACVLEGVKQFVFSSSAAVYGVPAKPKVTEDAPTDPANPYGYSKLMTEWMLRDAAAVHDLRFIALRYFNVAGADLKGRTGQSTPHATHLIKRACQVALGKEPYVEIFGTDFPTPDGTGMRDYIHVADLVEAHILALEALRRGRKAAIFNCGSGRGISVLEIIGAIERVSGKRIATRPALRRPGDVAEIVADPARIREQLNWVCHHADTAEIVRSALEWERRDCQ